jgi:O-methyltransferase
MKKDRELLKRVIIGSASQDERTKFFNGSLNQKEIKDIKEREISEKKKIGREWPVPDNAETMIGYERLKNLEDCIDSILANNIEGDIIETGVWKGGACIFMKYLLNEGKSDKKVYVCDSFEGLPKPDIEKYPKDKGDNHHEISELSVSKEDVKLNFERYDLLDDKVVFLKGWFKDTLPSIDSNHKFSLIRLDGDMYESTMDSLTNLYHKLSPGGYVVIDDFCLSPCVDAVMKFREEQGIKNEIVKIDYTGVFWKK